jgi:hypothetical protein
MTRSEIKGLFLVSGLLLMVSGVGISLTIGTSPLGIVFPIGATLWWIAALMDEHK